MGIGFKFGSGGDDVHGYYRVVSDAFAAMDLGNRIGDDLVQELNARYLRVKDQLQRRSEGNR
jgi:hypothetical protein